MPETPQPAPAAPPPAATDKAMPGSLEVPWARDPVARALRAIRRRQHLYTLLAVLVGGACFLLLYLLVEMFGDRLWEFTGLTRITMLHVALAVALTGGCTMAALILLRGRNPLAYARAVDRALGLNDDALLTYVDLRRRAKLEASERDAAEILAQEARERLMQIDADRVVNLRALAWGGRAAGVLLVVLLGFAVWCGSTFGLTLKRAVMPWLDLPAPRETWIHSVAPGDARIAVGEPVRFEVKLSLSSIRPRTATLRYLITGEDEEREVALPAVESGVYALELPGFARPVSYNVECNDARKGPFYLTPVDRPLVTAVKLRVQPPSYAPYAPAREVEGGHVEAVRGCRIEVEAAVSQPPAAAPVDGRPAAWIEMGSRRLPMQVKHGRLFGTFNLTADASYRIGYIGASGFESSPGVLYQAKARPDAAPNALLQRLGIPEGQPSVPVTADGVVVLRCLGSDDLGIRKATLRYGIEGQEDRASACTPPAQAQALKIVRTIDLPSLDARAGQVLTCELAVEDNYVPEPHRVVSATLRIPIVAPDPAQPKPEAPPTELLDPFKDLKLELEAAKQADPKKTKVGKSDEPAKLDEKLAQELDELTDKQQHKLEELLKRLEAEDKPDSEEAQKLAAEQERLAEKLQEMLEQEDQKPRETAGANPDSADAEQQMQDMDRPKEGNSAEQQQEKGEKGEQNSEGKQGGEGKQGEQSGEGKQGEQGGEGKQGEQGGEGKQGEQGGEGKQGEQGSEGKQGEQGSEGKQGEQGGEGKQGEQGGEGKQGEQGGEGKQGEQGSEGKQGEQGSEGKQGEQGGEGRQGEQGGEGKQGEQGGEGKQGEQGGEGKQGEQGGEGKQGEGQGKGQGEGQGKGQGEGQGKGQGEGQGKGQGEGQGKGQGEGQGKGQGEGQGKGQGEGQGKGQGEGQGKDAPKAGQGTSSGNSSGGGGGNTIQNDKLGEGPDFKETEISGVERSRERTERSLRMKAMQDMASAVAKRLREGKVDGETVRLAREALDGLSAAGRRFDQSDRERMAKTAEALTKEQARSGKDGNLRPDAGKTPDGRVREQLTGTGTQLGRIERDGKAAEPDPVQRAIEEGQAKVAPEYRKALEAYYKEVSK